MFQKIVVLLFFIFYITQSNSQLKFEREYRLDENKVPLKAIKFSDSLDLSRKIKWFKEEGIDGHTIEAKTKHNGKKLSIEFDENGNLQDIEITISCSEIPDSVLSIICKNLQEKYIKYTFKKVQKQYTGDRFLMKTVTSNLPSKDLIIHYEIVLLVKKQNEHKKIECLFSSSGTLIMESEIIEGSTDHLEY